MEKSCPADSSTSNTTSNSSSSKGDQFLKQLNKCSLKISKPPHLRKPLDHSLDPPPSSSSSPAQPQAQQQPPVYNINKNDFRHVVQKLTGISPARGPSSSRPPPAAPPPPALQAPKPPASRFHRFRPPPLAPPPPTPPPSFVHASQSPFSPLPPLPSVCAAAESPISAYLRFLHSSSANSSLPLPQPSPPFTFSPFPLLSPTGGQLGFPASPGVPVPSPRWRDL